MSVAPEEKKRQQCLRRRGFPDSPRQEVARTRSEPGIAKRESRQPAPGWTGSVVLAGDGSREWLNETPHRSGDEEAWKASGRPQPWEECRRRLASFLRIIMVMLKVIQVGIVADHFRCQSGRSLTCRHLLCLGFDILWNVQSASLGIWSRAVRMRMARTCSPRSRAAGMSTPCTADAKQRRAGGSPASSAKFQRRLLSAATERPRRSR